MITASSKSAESYMTHGGYAPRQVQARYIEDDHNSNWVGVSGSADAEIIPELPELRQRTRDLDQTNAYSISGTDIRVTKVVDTGIRAVPTLNFKALDMDKGDVRDLERLISRLFAKWSRSADFTGKHDFFGLQQLIKRAREVSGSCYVLRRPGNTWEVFEPERIATPFDMAGDTDIREGIQYENGKVVAYWVLKQHPNDYNAFTNFTTQQFTKVPAFDRAGNPNILHVYDQRRPGQGHGIGRFAGITGYLRDTIRYTQAELEGARGAACIMLAITSEEPVKTQAGNKDTFEDMAPGMVFNLGEGQTIELLDPKRAGKDYADFMDKHENIISTAIGMSPQTLMHNTAKESFSAAKSRNMTENDQWKIERADLVKDVCRPMYELALDWFVLEGLLPIDDYFLKRDLYTAVTWHVDPPRELEPLKAAQADVLMLREKLMTYTEYYAKTGRDIEDVADVLEREDDIADEHDIVFGDITGRTVADEAELTDEDDEDDQATPQEAEDE